MDVLIYLGKSAGILTMFYIVYYFILRKDTFFTANRHFLLSGIIAAIALPFLEFTKITYIETPSNVVTDSVRSTLDSVPAFQEAVGPSFNLDWWQVLLFIYIFGCAVMGLRLLLQLFSLLKLLRKHPSIKQGEFKFVKVNEQVSPFSFFRYIVFNPRLHSEKEISMILAHEKVHAKQWHSVDILLTNLIRVTLWINPISWLYKKRLEENLEFIADDETVQIISSKKEYQLALVKASSALYAPALTVQFYQSFIKKRIIMLNKSNSNKYNQLKVSLILPFLALFLWSFNVTEVVSYKNSEIPLKTETDASALTNEGADYGSETTNLFADNISAKPEIKTIERTSEVVSTPHTEKEITPTKPSNLIAKVISPEREATLGSLITRKAQRVFKDYQFTITSKTTDAELEKLKTELKRDHGLNMNYSVDRNGSGHITALSISYTGNGNSGSYSVDEEGPIEDFFFYAKENGDTGFWSKSHEIRHEQRIERSKNMTERRADKFTERQEKMEKRVEKRAEAMEKRHIDLEERRVEMEDRRNEMAARVQEQRERIEEREEEEMHEHLQEMKAHKKHVEREHKKLKKQHKNISHIRSGGGNNYSYHSDNHGSEHSIILDKDTTNATLQKMKNKLAAKGISFSFSKIKRNSQGELTRIKIEVDNGKGSKQSIYTKTDDGEPIDEMIIQL